jgi:hypothetical protein
LASALTAGARLIFAPDPARPVFDGSAETRARLEALLTPEAKPTTQALLHHAVTYRGVLRRIFRGMTDPVTVDEAEARDLINGERRCVDELGVALADAVRAQIAEEWTGETGRCPWCGGLAHDTGDKGDER